MGRVSIITDVGETIPVADEGGSGEATFVSNGVSIDFKVLTGKHQKEGFAAYSIRESISKMGRDGSVGIGKKPLIEGYNFFIHHER